MFAHSAADRKEAYTYENIFHGNTLHLCFPFISFCIKSCLRIQGTPNFIMQILRKRGKAGDKLIISVVMIMIMMIMFMAIMIRNISMRLL